MAGRPRPFLGLVAGVAAGLAASAAMAAFQARAAKLLPDEGEDAEPATAEAAGTRSEAATGVPVPEAGRTRAGRAAPYIVGGVLGGIYGVLAEYRPEARSGFGATYGIATAALLDEAARPAAGPAPASEDAPRFARAPGIASHLLYGWVLEGVRALLAGKR